MKFSFGKNKFKKLVDNSVLKKKDSLIGLPVLFALTGFSSIRNAFKPEIINKIAVIKLNSVRDVVFTADGIKALKKAYPNATITYFAGEDNFNMSSALEGISNTVRIFGNDLSKSMKIVKNAGHFDLWIDFGVWSRFEAIMTQTAKASYKIGFKTDGEHRHFAYDKVVEYIFESHYKDNIRFLLSSIGVNVAEEKTDDVRNSEKVTNQVVVDIFADTVEQNCRKWSHNNWKVVVEYLNKLKYRVALIGNKKDVEEAEIFNELLGGKADVDFLVGRLDFADKVKLFKQSALVIACDNSSLHTAVYYNVPVIALYGPTNSKRYGPKGDNAYILSSLTCNSCQSLYGDEKCSMDNPDCMESIQPQSVIDKIDLVLGANIEKN